MMNNTKWVGAITPFGGAALSGDGVMILLALAKKNKDLKPFYFPVQCDQRSFLVFNRKFHVNILSSFFHVL